MTARPTGFLVTGGTGTTGSRVTATLADRGLPVRAGSRTPAPGTRQVRFDWADPATHGPALSDVGAVYLVPPIGDADPARLMLPLLERARDAGVRRFVLLSSSAITEGDPGVGEVHRGLRQLAPEWAVLRPSWFMQNFVTPGHLHAESIRTTGEIVTATGQGRVAFVDAADIADVAVHALLDARPHNAAHVITGPEALSYREVAEAISTTSGRGVRHRPVSTAEFRARLTASGVPEDYARMLAAMDEGISRGTEDRVSPAVRGVTGRGARSFRDFACGHAGRWRAA
ncbi:NAD(P)H-binding protein [Streptomyces sp. MZ04]|uniref:NmrA family NAD(P)-binding protein n=1 Tax=Streptomyces sp. MZ04 TaxID=2559236 RepID=UPI00107ED912|nr:NAD(P)H-binding protein [Streptomyces sp. MZ04]TGB14910.1 NAD-dependent epimerase/dehydratase family protein [Streptomyces sp. MZ04]